jgi:exopolysaccharide biosynthesis WecB/TagA/CpsF family protein
MKATSNPRRPLELAISASVVALTLPAWPVLAWRAMRQHGRVFDYCDVSTGRAVTGFAGGGSLSGSAGLLSVIKGKLSLVGPRPRQASETLPEDLQQYRPGLISVHQIRSEMGLAAGEEEVIADREMMKDLSARKTLGILIRKFLAGTFSSGRSSQPSRLPLLGIDVDNLSMSESIAKIVSAARGDDTQSFAFVNPDCLNRAASYQPYARVLSRQDAVFADGIGLRIAAAFRGFGLKGNVNGTDMFPLLCEAAAAEGLKLFLLGARPGLAEEVARTMCERYPSLEIAGTQDGYFDASEEEKVIDNINASAAHILLVAFGAPLQEMWIDRNRDRLKVGAAIGVGGLFDFFSGRISRAPLWLREAGFEWIWRFLQEPKRMWKRYFVGNPVFLWRAFSEQRQIKRQTHAPAFPWKSSDAAQSRKRRWLTRTTTFNAGKRALDVLGASCGLLALSPILGATALAIRLESPGPIFFSQTRVGVGGKRFKVWKFRSMYIDAEARRQALLAQSDREGAHFKMKNDPRITRVGRIIRRFSIDELPQLFNVLNGTMSIVGPRPNLESEVARYKLEEFGRLDAKPGITCIWQVSGRAELPWDKQVALDLDYVYEPSLLADLNLIVRTVPAVVSGRGAY